MKKIATLLIVLMVAGAAPGWCLLPTVDGYVMDHTQSSFRPVEDAGKVYETVNHGIDTALDKVPGVQIRPMIFEPVDHVLKTSLDATKVVVNGVWDVVTLKPIRTSGGE
jgi:hypothetical protein